MTTVLGIILIAASIFLIVAVLMQSSKSHRLSGTIAGGAETFFGKTKGSSIDKKLSKLTTVVAIVFVIAVLAVYLIQDTTDFSNIDFDADIADDTGDAAVTDEPGGAVPEEDDAAETTEAAETTDATDTTEAPAETTEATETTADDVVTEAPAEETTGDAAGE